VCALCVSVRVMCVVLVFVGAKFTEKPQA
jgi:hypothetical protein